MIIFGTRGVKSTKERGRFLCPQCASEQEYKHKSARRFFTLYFIPLIPLDKLGEYVECQTCRGTFVPRVLEYNPQAQSDQIANEFQSIYEKAMRHSMVLMMLADGHIDDNEMKTVLEIINKYGHHDLSIGDLEDYVKQVQRQQEPVGTYLKKVGPSLNEHGKELIIKCAIAVASSDGHIDDSEISLIHEMAKEMEMSSSHLKGILTENLPEQASLN